MKTIAHVLLAAIITSGLLAVDTLHAEEQLQRYIVVLKQRSGAVPDVASLGGKIEFRQDDQLIVTIPPGALAVLKADPKVRYVEQVGGTPSDDEPPLIGVPSDPRPGPSTQAARFTPHALGSLAWDSGSYAYDGAGNIVSIGTDNYLYDGVQRLRQSSTQGTPETYTYDGFGNMKTKTNTIMPTVQPSTNRYDGYGYNEIGAVTSDGSYAFSYDALGQPLSKIYNSDPSKLEYYVYTPGDERIGVQRGGWWTWSVRDEGGKVLRQYKSSSTNPSAASLWLEDFVWRDGLLLGSQRPVELGGRRHFHLDHLGSPRLITGDNGQMVSYHDYYPFGDEHSPASQEVAHGFDREDPMKFTSHERDYAGGMGGEDGHAIDDMHARYYGPTNGRFLSVDPVEGDLASPQSWNRYAYVANNPIMQVDPTGRLSAEAIYGSNSFDETFTSFADDQNEGGKSDNAGPQSRPTAKPEPAGGPPIPVPGAEDVGWKYNQNPENKRGGSYGPKKPIRGQSQPTASWEGGATVPHWDVDDGKGGRRRYDDKGQYVSPEAAHGKPSSRALMPSIRRLPWNDVLTITGLTLFGVAVEAMTGGQLTLRPAAGIVIIRPVSPVRELNSKCPYCI